MKGQCGEILYRSAEDMMLRGRIKLESYWDDCWLDDEETKSISLSKLFDVSFHWQYMGYGIDINIGPWNISLFIWK